MTTSNAPNAKEQQNAKIGAWKEHVADIDLRVQQFKAFQTQTKAQLDQVARNIDTQIANWITALEAIRKTVKAKIDAGL